MKPLSILLGTVVISSAGILGYSSGIFDQPVNSSESTIFASNNSDSGTTLASQRVVMKKPASENGLVTLNDQEKIEKEKKENPNSIRANQKKRVPMKPVPLAKPTAKKPSSGKNIAERETDSDALISRPSVTQPNSSSKSQPKQTKPSTNKAVGKTTGEADAKPDHVFRLGGGPQQMTADPLPEQVENRNANRVARPKKALEDPVEAIKKPNVRVENNGDKATKQPLQNPPRNRRPQLGDFDGPRQADVPPAQIPSSVPKAQRGNQQAQGQNRQQGVGQIDGRLTPSPARRPIANNQRPNANNRPAVRDGGGIQKIDQRNQQNLQGNASRRKEMGDGPHPLTPPPLVIPQGAQNFRQGRPVGQRGNGAQNLRARDQGNRGPAVAMDVEDLGGSGNANRADGRNNPVRRPRVQNGKGPQSLDNSAARPGELSAGQRPAEDTRTQRKRSGTTPTKATGQGVGEDKTNGANKATKNGVAQATFDSDVPAASKNKPQNYEDEMKAMREKYDRLKKQYDALSGGK
ncbi:MAG: hypothetical protein AB8B55_20240 [Mariniblastus sp.]